MDIRTANNEVQAKIEEIKRFMPATYTAILAKAEVVGNEVFVWVRRGLRGEPNCFYAIEGLRVVGQPFDRGDVYRELVRWQRLYGPVDVVFFATEGVF